MNLSNAESIYIENKEVESIYITNKLAWENGTNINIDTPFKERTTANGTVISGTRAKVLSISGQSILFNQKCKKVNSMWFPEGLTFIGGSSDDDYIGARITDATKLVTSTNLPLAAEFFTPKKGHTYLYKIKIKCNFPNAACGFKIYNVASTQNYVYGDSWTEIVDIINVSDSPTEPAKFEIYPFRGGVPANGKEFYFKKEVQIFDLYEMLGTNTKFLGVDNFTTATNKTAAITKFNELFNADYYAYNDGYAINFEGLPNTTFVQSAQIIQRAGITRNGITITNNKDGKYKINGTATADVYWYGNANPCTIISGHKYYFKNIYNNFRYYSTGGYPSSITREGIYNITVAGNEPYLYIICQTGEIFDNKVYIPQIFDLTAIFGAGNEPSTVEEFEAWMKKYGLNPNEFQNYTTGTTLYGTRINSIGINIWDEQWELGIYSRADGGTKKPSATQIRCINKIQVTPSTIYNFHNGSNVPGQVLEYDKNGNYLDYWSLMANSDRPITLSSNTYFVTFFINESIYNNNFAIYPSNPAFDGHYYPYINDTCKIPNVVLRRVGNVCDEIQGNKIIRRVGVVDLGSLSGVEKWYAGTNETFYAKLYNKKCGSLEVMCDGFLKGEAGKMFAFAQAPNYNDLILRGCGGATNNYIYAKAIGYSLQNFITAVTGTKLYYELETPTEETITWTNNYQCQNQGTEKILPYNTSMDGFSCLPIQCNVKYKH